MSPEAVRAAYAALRDEVGPDVTVVVATKYVPLEEMAVLAEAGVEVVGENRAQDLERKHAEYGDAFRWHFIGHLQSNKAKIVNRICELVHSLDSDSAARRLTVPALVEVNLAGEASKSGSAPDDLGAFLREHPGARGLMTMPPETADAEALAAVLPPPARARRGARPGRALDGNVPGLPRRGGGGSDPDPGRIRPLPGVTSARRWASRTSGTERSCTSGSPRTRSGTRTATRRTRSSSAPTARASGANVRRLQPRRGRDFDDWSDPEPAPASAEPRPATRLRGVEAVPNAGSVKVHLVLPRSFNDAQQIADRFKDGVPVILNLQSADQDLSKRLIDFASGLTYALDGGMQRVADKVFLLTPRNVEVSAEERARMLERGGFYNQA